MSGVAARFVPAACAPAAAAVMSRGTLVNGVVGGGGGQTPHDFTLRLIEFIPRTQGVRVATRASFWSVVIHHDSTTSGATNEAMRARAAAAAAV